MEAVKTGPKLFEELRIISLAWIGVGPRTTKYLAEYGAEVIKIESRLRPDPIRFVTPFMDSKPGLESSQTYSKVNDTFYNISLNFKNPRGLEVAKRLIAKSDIVVDGWTPGTLDKLGLSYADLQKIKPDIILLSTCMQGQTGPSAKSSGTGNVMASLAGYNYITGWPDRPPSGTYGPFTDFIAPMLNVVAIIAAIDYRRRTGKGQHLDLSQYEGGLQVLSPLILDYVVNGRELTRRGNSCPYAAPHGVYRCKGDDRWCAITVFTDEEWASFCDVLGNPEWTKETRFATVLGRVKNSSELDRLVQGWTINRPAEEVMESMQKAGVAAGVAETGEDQWNDPQIKYRNTLSLMEHPETRKCVIQRLGTTLTGIPYEVRRPPMLGEHTEYICKKVLDMTDDEFIKLKNEGVFE